MEAQLSSASVRPWWPAMPTHPHISVHDTQWEKGRVILAGQSQTQQEFCAPVNIQGHGMERWQQGESGGAVEVSKCLFFYAAPSHPHIISFNVPDNPFKRGLSHAQLGNMKTMPNEWSDFVFGIILILDFAGMTSQINTAIFSKLCILTCRT
ncbi:hypothetical protein GDO81_029425 [Engystomops pustulosus]|uniref:Uncharacterized protein n=1 Tax=Engystomops pustulosus TaxID=76066 RepID=A0AAV6Z1X0_ENGPU|nr:hypothetical protein GDO81_029425 [Engystomops pustulosus]